MKRATIDSFAYRIAVLGAAIFALGAATDALALSSAWQRSDVTEVRLVSAQDAIDVAGKASIGLQFRLAPGWKIYWRSPGESGLAPQIDWSGSANLETVAVSWPLPERFIEIGELVTHGYKDEVVLPIVASATDPARPTVLRAVVNYLACEQICVPFSAELKLALPPGPAGPTAFGGLIADYLARVPGPPTASGPAIDRVEAVGAGPDRLLRVVARAPEPFAEPVVFVEGGDRYYFAAPELELLDGGREAVFRLAAPARGEAPALTGASFTVTLADRGRAVEQTLVAVAGKAEGPRLGAFAVILMLAMVGGLILNLMPCVLPVLSIKVMGVIGMAGTERRRVTMRFLATTAGIVVSFLVLGGAVAGFKAAGHAVGWGVQFQEPLFIVAMVAVVTLFACNLWGLFEVHLPVSIGGAAVAGRAPGSLSGDFASGAFATLLATPCSAPFLGTSVSFALARGPLEIVAVFAALGLGMAAPYLAFAAFPGLAARLPRPGPWMVTLRRVLGVLLAATGIWLLSVLAAQAGMTAALAVGALMVAVGLALWFAARGAGRRGIAGGVIAALVALAFVAPGQLARPTAEALTIAAEALWQPFDRAEIARLVAAGKTVFVDVTADWCVTCEFNKKTVLDRGEVARRLASEQTVAMRADWTLPNADIAAYLEAFGRYGIPFNVVYGPALPRGLPLPELLTEDVVMAAFNRAGSAVASAE